MASLPGREIDTRQVDRASGHPEGAKSSAEYKGQRTRDGGSMMVWIRCRYVLVGTVMR